MRFDNKGDEKWYDKYYWAEFVGGALIVFLLGIIAMILPGLIVYLRDGHL